MRVGRIVGAVAIVLAGGLYLAPPGHAEVHDIQLRVRSGGLSAGALEVPLHGSSLSARWDTGTGKVRNGTLVVPPQEIHYEVSGEPVTVTATITSLDPVFGTIDRSTGAARLVTRLALSLAGEGTSGDCESRPIPIVLRTAKPGEAFDFFDGSAALAASGFAVPGFVDCIGANGTGDVSDFVNTIFGLPTTDSSAIAGVRMVADPPGRPRNVEAVPRDRAARISWTPPADSGGAPILGYVVVATPSDERCFTAGALNCTVRGLSNGTRYTFEVRARNLEGLGPFSEPSNPVRPSA